MCVCVCGVVVVSLAPGSKVPPPPPPPPPRRPPPPRPPPPPPPPRVQAQTQAIFHLPLTSPPSCDWVGLWVPTPLAVRKGLFSCEFLARLQELCLHGSQCLLSAQVSWLYQVHITTSGCKRIYIVYMCVQIFPVTRYIVFVSCVCCYICIDQCVCVCV